MQLSSQLIQSLTDPIRGLRGVDDFVRTSVPTLQAAFGASRAVFIERTALPQRGWASGRAMAPGQTATPELDPPPRAVHFVDWPPGWADCYLARHWAGDPIRHWLARPVCDRAPMVATLSDLVPAPQLVRADWFQELMAPADARHVLSMAMREGRRVTGVLSLVRSLSDGDFSQDERQCLTTLAPLLTLAYGLALDRADLERGARAGAPGGGPQGDGDDPRLRQLTPRESDVFGWLLQGCSNKHIARQLAVSPFTVKNLLRGVYRKLQARRRAELCARYAGTPAQRRISESAACQPDQCD